MSAAQWRAVWREQGAAFNAIVEVQAVTRTEKDGMITYHGCRAPNTSGQYTVTFEAVPEPERPIVTDAMIPQDTFVLDRQWIRAIVRASIRATVESWAAVGLSFRRGPSGVTYDPSRLLADLGCTEP